jgi:hypothetical protein
MKLRTVLVGAVAGLLLTACGGGSTPDEVTKQFAQALADGDCEKAKGMAVDEALTNIQGLVDTGCEGYATEIVSVNCETKEETADCTCEEKRDGMDMKFKYNLKKVEGDWKVSAYNKDLGMDMDLGGGEGE